MAESRRPAEESKAMLIRAAVDVIRTEGYGALSAKRLAEKVGLKRQIVHYYFRTVDQLLLSVVRFYGDAGLARLQSLLQQDPLRTLWEVQADASATTFAFMAMATHRPKVKVALRHYMDAFRKLQSDAISSYFKSRGITPAVPAAAAAIIVQSVSQALAAETTMGVARGHAETKAVMEAVLESLANTGKLDGGYTRRGQRR